MKRILAFLFWSVTFVCVNGQSQELRRIILSSSYIDPTEEVDNTTHKSPMQPPLVFLDGFSLYFGESYSEAVPVELRDASGNVVYSDYLPAGTQTLSLPTTLSGTYTLFIYMGNYIFAGLITL